MSATPASNKKILGIVFFTVFLDLVGFGIIIPIQPFFAEKLGAAPSTVTLLGASFSLMQFLFGSFWGRLSDRIGRRPVMLVSIAASVVGYTVFGLAESLPILFLARMLAGFGSANIGAAQAIIADSTTPDKRAKGMGLIGAAFGLGFIFGPALGGFFGQFGLATPAFVAAGLGFLNFIFAFTSLPETSPQKVGAATRSLNGQVLPEHQKVKQEVQQTAQHRPGFSLKALKHAARHKNVAQIFMIYFLFIAAFAMMEQVLGLFIEHIWHPRGIEAVVGLRMKQSAAETAYVLIMVGITATIVQGGLIGKLVKRFGERKLLMVGLVWVAFNLAVVPFIGMSGLFPLMLLWGSTMAMGTGITNPSLSSLLSQSVDSDEQGGALGLGQSLAALGRVLGPSAAGFLFERSPYIPFWIGCGLVLVAVGVAGSIKTKAA